ncbi:MAG: rod shape-determining protein MreC [Verrucomicrobiota bacterium JB023]|nr:rod shape-determining protein MreC [Verrucomicrobiota bacterium JB023]
MKPLNLIALLLFLGVGTWVLTWSPHTVREVQFTYYKAITPFLHGGSGIDNFARAFVKEVEHSKTLERKLQAIQENYEGLKIIEGRFLEMERENAQLNRALDFRERTPFKVIPAKVIKRQPSAWWDTVTINRGEPAGIGPQLTVLAEGGLVGRVDKSFDTDVAEVVLVSDESCQVSVYIEGTPEKGILSGQPGQFGGDPLLRVRYLSKNAAIQPGMRVLTTGSGRLFPPDIMVGTVVRRIPGSYEDEALVKPSVDLHNLNVVFVLTGDQPNETGDKAEDKE